MTRMIPTVDTAHVAHIHAAPPVVALADRAAANVGLADSQRLGIRARLFLQRHRRMARIVERLFGFGSENRLADDRMEAIRSFALAEALAGRAAPAEALVRRWRADA